MGVGEMPNSSNGPPYAAQECMPKKSRLGYCLCPHPHHPHCPCRTKFWGIFIAWVRWPALQKSVGLTSESSEFQSYRYRLTCQRAATEGGGTLVLAESEKVGACFALLPTLHAPLFSQAGTFSCLTLSMVAFGWQDLKRTRGSHPRAHTASLCSACRHPVTLWPSNSPSPTPHGNCKSPKRPGSLTGWGHA